MKVSNISKLLVIASLSVNTLAFAQQEAPQSQLSQVSVSLQAGKLEQLKASLVLLSEKQKSIQAFNKAIGEAKKTEGGYEVIFDESMSTIHWSKFFFIVSILSKVGMKFFPLNPASIAGERPVRILMIASGVVLGGGILGAAGSQYKLIQSAGEREEMLRNIADAQSVMDTQKAVVAQMSKGLGATVNQSIISYEGVPNAVKYLGVSKLDLNQIDLNQ